MKKTSARAAAEQAAPRPNLAAALKLVMRMMAIPGSSGQEGKVIRFIRQKLEQAGVPADALTLDNTPEKSPIGGETGGLILKLPGTLRGKRRLLMAHVDTVPLCVGCEPVRRNGFIESANPATGLGADDRAGATVVLNTALEILRRKLPHPPLTFFWAVQEEVGLHGARHVPLGLLGKPSLAFNWDGSDFNKVVTGATGAYRIQVTIRGLASHAGGAPERGVSAVAIAGLAIAELQRGGWHGAINKNGKYGTSNIGVVQGGAATNVVTDRLFLRAEARSHDPDFRVKIADTIAEAFRKAAREVTNVDGVHGEVEIERQLDYESFRLADDEPCVQAAETAVRAVGGDPYRVVINGGLDANWMSARGIPTVTLGCGQMNVHTVAEKLDIDAFERACCIGLRLATATEDSP